MTLVLAFDIERSGGYSKHHTLAIGASVVSEDFKELDSIFLPMYLPLQILFEDRCWNEFWSKNINVLEQLKYNGEATSIPDIEKEAIRKFQAFRVKWETYADENNLKLELVTDNNVYDGVQLLNFYLEK